MLEMSSESRESRHSVREAFLFFRSRQLMVAKMNKRAGAKKTYDSGELLSSADAPYKRCVCQRNANLKGIKSNTTIQVTNSAHTPVGSMCVLVHNT